MFLHSIGVRYRTCLTLHASTLLGRYNEERQRKVVKTSTIVGCSSLNFFVDAHIVPGMPVYVFIIPQFRPFLVCLLPQRGIAYRTRERSRSWYPRPLGEKLKEVFWLHQRLQAKGIAIHFQLRRGVKGSKKNDIYVSGDLLIVPAVAPCGVWSSTRFAAIPYLVPGIT